MKVKVELMSMDSDLGYVPSSGFTEAVLVSAVDAARCGNDVDSLFRLEGMQITTGRLDDVEERTSKSGVCNYHVITGVFDVPDDMAVVQRGHVDICTRDEPYSNAWVVNVESLKELYEQRAIEYTRLAMELK